MHSLVARKGTRSFTSRWRRDFPFAGVNNFALDSCLRLFPGLLPNLPTPEARETYA